MGVQGGFSQRRLRSEICVRSSDNDSDSETAARTRPLSFDEIMRKRKDNKKVAEDVNEEARKESGKPSSSSRKETTALDATGGSSTHDRYNSSSGKDNTRGHHDTKSRSDDAHRSNPRVKEKEERLSKRESDYGKSSKNRESRESEVKHGHKTDTDIGSKSNHKADLKQKVEKERVAQRVHTSGGGRDHGREKVHERPKGDSEYNGGKDNYRDNVGKGRHSDRSRTASERESKRKDRNGDDAKHTERHPIKKHDSGKKLTSEISERKERTDTSHHRHDEARLKRRRSKSPNHNRGRKSRSSSPRVIKHSTSHGHDIHGDRDRSSRHHPDADRSKVSNNDSSAVYRRHGGSSSGIGGYSPRKRKTEAAVKTPSPPKRSPEKRNAGWDLPLLGALSKSAVSASSALHNFPQALPLSVIETTRLSLAVSNAALNLTRATPTNSAVTMNPSIDSIQLTQATRPRRRLYIDNVPGSASEKEIMECFNRFLLSSGANYIQGTLPCISCIIHKEKGQALLEFLTPEDASAALAFDGRSFSGCPLKIRRPKDFVDAASDSLEKLKAESEPISDFVMDSPNKVFIGGISESLSSEMLMEIVSAFGPLKAYCFVTDKNLNAPCAFLEYADLSVTTKACAGLNGMKLGGKILTAALAFPNVSSMDLSGSTPLNGIPEHVKPLLEEPTTVLKIKNVLDAEAVESLSQSELEEILEDVRQECARFGSVKSINIVKAVDASDPEKVEVEDLDGSCPTSKGSSLVEPMESLNVDAGSSGIKVSTSDAGKQAEAEGVAKEDYNDDNKASPPVRVLTTPAEETNHVDQVEESRAVDRNNNNDLRNDEHSLGFDDKVERNEPDTTTAQEVCDSKTGIATVEVGAEPNEEDKYGNTSQKDSDVCIQSEPEKQNGTLQEDASALNGDTSGGDVVELNEKVDRGGNLEVGCILVEFRREEASCLAAHNLHGRPFDDRAVTVEYVPFQLYEARFLK